MITNRWHSEYQIDNTFFFTRSKLCLGTSLTLFWKHSKKVSYSLVTSPMRRNKSRIYTWESVPAPPRVLALTPLDDELLIEKYIVDPRHQSPRSLGQPYSRERKTVIWRHVSSAAREKVSNILDPSPFYLAVQRPVKYNTYVESAKPACVFYSRVTCVGMNQMANLIANTLQSFLLLIPGSTPLPSFKCFYSAFTITGHTPYFFFCLSFYHLIMPLNTGVQLYPTLSFM